MSATTPWQGQYQDLRRGGRHLISQCGPKAGAIEGASLKHVVRVTCYLTDLADYPIYRRARPFLSADAIAVVKTKG
jgi:hypothetical protein